MAFKSEMVSDFKSSMSFLIDSMLETLNYSSRGDIMGSKPSHTIQTEKFFSFYEKVMTSPDSEQEVLLQNLRNKVVAPVYEKHSVSFMSNLVGEDGKVADDFLKISATRDDDSLKIRTTPDGVYFQISKVFLPVSEVYTQALRLSLRHKQENLPFPNKILLGLYSSVFFAVRGTISKDVTDYFNENIGTLRESLEVCDEVKVKPMDSGPMGMIKNMLGNIDFNQIGEMMSKVSGDDKSSKEFGEVFGKLSDSIKNGENPLEVMGDIIKQATVDAAAEDTSGPGEQGEEVADEPVGDPEAAQTEEVAETVEETPAEDTTEELPESGL